MERTRKQQPHGRSIPVERALFPLIDKPDDQDAQKDHHGPEPNQTDVLEGHSPRKEKGDFEVKENEQDGHQVVADIEFHAGIFEGFEAAFVGGVLFAVRAIGAKDPAQDLGNDANCDPHQNEQQDWKVLVEIHRVMLPWMRSFRAEPRDCP